MRDELLDRRTAQEWETRLGRDVRDVRKRAGLTQAELARAANVSLSAVKNLEHGQGSSLKTVVQVARALDRSDWLGDFAPPAPTLNPMDLVRAQRARRTG